MANNENLKNFSKGEDPRRNVNGRPKGVISRNTIARKILAMPAKMPEELYEEMKLIYPKLEKNITMEDLITIVQLKQAISGDNQSYKLIMDSGHGTPKQEIEHLGELEIIQHVPLTIKIVPPTEE